MAAADIARWDAWLQQVMTGSRALLGAAWLDAYLTGPVWRYLEWPDAADGAALRVGLLMPSVDKVGRYFPLCVAAPMSRLPAGDDLRALLGWLDAVEALALATLDTRHGAQQFDDALLGLPPPDRSAAAAAAPAAVPPAPSLVETLAATLFDAARGAGRPVPNPPIASPEWPAGSSSADVLQALAGAALNASARGASLWWSGPAHAATHRMFACHALPDAATFAAMLQAHPATLG